MWVFEAALWICILVRRAFWGIVISFYVCSRFVWLGYLVFGGGGLAMFCVWGRLVCLLVYFDFSFC